MFVVKELTTATISFSLVDEADVAIPLSSLLTLTLTVKDMATETVVNGRDEQNIKNANGVTVDASGNVSWPMTQLDTTLVTASASSELHRALVDFTYDVSGVTKRYHEAIEIGIQGEAWVP